MPGLLGPDGKPLVVTDEDLGPGVAFVGRQLQEQIPAGAKFILVITRDVDAGRPLYYANMPAGEMRRLLYRTRDELDRNKKPDTAQA